MIDSYRIVSRISSEAWETFNQNQTFNLFLEKLFLFANEFVRVAFTSFYTSLYKYFVSSVRLSKPCQRNPLFNVGCTVASYDAYFVVFSCFVAIASNCKESKITEDFTSHFVSFTEKQHREYERIRQRTKRLDRIRSFERLQLRKQGKTWRESRDVSTHLRATGRRTPKLTC